MSSAKRRGPDLIELAVAKDHGITQGVLASIHPSALLSLLKKLGELGRRALERIADLALPRWRSGGKSDVWSHLAAIAQAVSEQFLKFVNGILSIRVGGIDLSWDLKLRRIQRSESAHQSQVPGPSIG